MQHLSVNLNISYINGPCQYIKSSILFHPVLCIAVSAAVNLVFPVHKSESVNDSLLYGSDAPWVLALHHIFKGLRQFHMMLSFKPAVLYDIYGDVAVHITQHIKVKVDYLVYFDNIFFAVLLTVSVLYNGNAVVYLIKTQKLINLHTLSCLDMV